ncbi:xylulokinase [Actinobaculum suis]|uniref:xylulokinase n=1 Tax=Actinobaculum suis TaxID=1657 RepID=UPI0008087D7B|nr:FGGY family carbohydrate kinase [Actinobaculum suis]OCA93909.1 xylulose kinase [Actinobaculum suis]OCA94823.1 xylulose kinase [Actinobaculum suis]
MQEAKHSEQSPQLVAGVDSSTQSTKILIVDARTGATVREGRAAHPTGTEVDPQAWLTAFREAAARAGGLADISGLSVAGQQHGMVLLDAAGEVIRPAQLWNDTKSAAAARALTAELGAEFWAQAVGSVPVASLTVTKLRWIADNEPENAARIAAICLPHDWLTWKLRGTADIRALTTDRSDASGTGYMDCETNEYRYDILAHALRITEAQARQLVLPRIAAPYESVGRVHPQFLEETGEAAASGTEAAAVTEATTSGTEANLPGTAQPKTSVPVFLGPGAGDNAGAALGLNLRPGQASISIGTSGVVAAIAEHPVRDAHSGVTGFADANGAWLPLACTLNGALIQDYFCELLGVSFERLGELAAQAAPGAGGVTLVPYFAGERTPNLPRATASLHGLTPDSTTPHNFARAAYEGLACLLRGALEALRDGGLRIERAMLIGGATRSAVLAQIMADVLQIPLDIPRPGEYVARGAARQAALVCGFDVSAPGWEPEITETITPGPANPAWPRYQKLAAAIAHAQAE